MNSEMKNMASRLGIDFPKDASEHEQLAAIANQVGMPDYYYNSADNNKLYNALQDMCGENGIPSDIAGTDYNPETEPDYMSDGYQRGLRRPGKEDEENPEGEDEKPDGENPEGEGEGEKGEGGDTGDDTVDPNSPENHVDPNNPENPVDPNNPGHPGQEGQGFDPNNPVENPGENGEVPNGQNGVAPPKENLDQRDEGTSSPGAPGSNGYGDVSQSQGSSSASSGSTSSQSTTTSQQSAPAGNQGGRPSANQGGAPSNGRPNANQGGNGGRPSAPGNRAGGQKEKQKGGSGGGGGPAPAGNGYGALMNRGNRGAASASGDPTSNARRNLNHNARARNGEGEGGQKKGGSPGLGRKEESSGGLLSGLGSRLRNGLASGLGLGRKEDRSVGPDGGGGSSAADKAGAKIKDKMKKAIMTYLKTHPFVLLVLIMIFFFIFIILFVIIGGNGAGGNGGNNNTSQTVTEGRSCNYSLNGILSSGTVDLNNVQVELVNCDAKKDNYTVLETIDFEKYVIGVALAEVSWYSDYPAYFQAQIVAARGFALKRNSAMCPSHPDNCFYGYNESTGKIRLRACTNDQVYCDYDKTCMKYPRSGKPTLYGPEAEKMSGSSVWKRQLSESTKSAILAAADEVKGKVLVDSSGNVIYTNFINTDQKQWYAYAKEGMNYEQILVKHYSSRGASGMSSSECTYAGVNYGDYSLTSEGDSILHQPLDTFLQSKGSSLEAFNKLIESNVEKNGYGTRTGVVAAAVTLIGELGDNYGVKVPYFWGGGHGDGVNVGAQSKWGSSKCHTYANGQSYNYCGLDCSGFVPWAIKNGGYNRAQGLAGNFFKSSGAKKVILKSNQAVLQPGDLLESSHHVILVVGIDNDKKEYICAEAMGNAYGVTFSRRSFAPTGYWGVDLTDYYNNKSNVRSK